MKILILCTGNSCRSQMAEAILQAFSKKNEVYSAGTKPAAEVHPKAIEVMKEFGLDLSTHFPKKVDNYLNEVWDYVITVCGGAKESCPMFVGQVKNRIHIGFEDPANAVGTTDEVLEKFRTIRDQILGKFFRFYNINLKEV